jgi:hypothetical protein
MPTGRVLAPKDARLWMVHDFSAEQAKQFARAASLPSDAFKPEFWRFPVNFDLGEVSISLLI